MPLQHRTIKNLCFYPLDTVRCAGDSGAWQLQL